MNTFLRLRVRLTVVCAVSTGLVLAGMAAASHSFAAAQLTRQFAQQFAGDCASALSHLREQPVLTHTWLRQTEAQSGLMLHLQSGSLQMLYADKDAARVELVYAALSTAQSVHGFDSAKQMFDPYQPNAVSFLFNHQSQQYHAMAASIQTEANRRLGTAPLTVTILKSRMEEEAQLVWLRNRFVLSVALSLLCLAVFAWYFSGWAARPMEESRKRQLAFVSAASHEFRSPVAVIQLGAENLRDAPPEHSARFIDIILRECKHLARLTEDMLKVAGADNQSLSITLLEVNPEAILRSAYESYEGMARQRNLTLTLELPEQPLPRLRCDRGRVEQVLDILLDNALRYTPDGGTIALQACQQKQRIVFSVADTGPGIPDEEKARVFDRFYRADSARTDKEHYGLGLSVAKELVTLHRGELTVQDALPHGCVFLVSLPFLQKF